MTKNILLFLSALILFTSDAFAQEGVSIDDRNIHQYKGRLGIWVDAEANLSKIIQLSGASDNEIAQLNYGSAKKGYVFVPYSEKYIQALEDSGVVRKIIESKDTEFIWPLDSPDHISSPFGYRNRNFHAGIDIPAAKGTPVVAAMDGRVVSCAYAGGHGNSILIAHNNNFYTRYSHNSAMLVKPGEDVKKGQVIALAGSTGNSTGPHLHFEIRFNDIPLNPLDFLPPDDDIVVIKYKKKRR
ncbi:MAG: M23 family metallopeptidase [Spirochaetia bacterium]|jgi:murein DD-endopeptidase MepM/ murein hydrolase activator NlpD|nr:M23 family metallopeptidase [Spirochaetia bacterium]